MQAKLTSSIAAKRAVRKVATLWIIFTVALAIISPARALAADAFRVDEGDKYGWKVPMQKGDGGTINAFLGQVASEKGVPQFCVNLTWNEPDPQDAVVSVDAVPQPTVKVPGYEMTPAQMAWILRKYQSERNQDNYAAIGLLVHANFERPSDHSDNFTEVSKLYGLTPQGIATNLVAAAEKYAPDIAQRAKQYRQLAIASGVKKYTNEVVTGEGTRHGRVTGFGVQDAQGKYLSGVKITATLTGSAVWEDTGTSKITFTSADKPLSKAWRATGNSAVHFQWSYAAPVDVLERLHRVNSQETIRLSGAPKTQDRFANKRDWQVVYDFQPMGRSQVTKVTQEDGLFTDTLSAQADPKYGVEKSQGAWLTQAQVGLGDKSAAPVPVVYTARAYQVGTPQLPTFAESGRIPANAKLIGTEKVRAAGAGDISATFQAPEPGWYVTVWSVSKADQGEFADAIKADWNDGWAQTAETVARLYPAKIDSSLAIRETKAGQYLVDDVWVSGLPADHPHFAGGMDGRFAPDAPEIMHKVLFFPQGLAVSDENLAQAQQIGDPVAIPAKNGFYPAVGDTSWRALTDANGKLTPGTYVFVSEYPGDDRSYPLRTSVTDKTEQYVVEDTPVTLHTTATDASDGDTVLAPNSTAAITDRVCPVGGRLKPGTTYEIATALFASDGQPITRPDGTPVRAVSKFTPQRADECAQVTITFDASALAGKKVVVFEDVLLDKATVSTHHDLQDAEQTVTFARPDLPATGMAGLGWLIGVSVSLCAAGSALMLARR